jgi:nitroimidazol reductase NimA-like FMN-containing flavoprotein (pyridoxamine 5'-phosphate oxidase superfamily)
MKPKKFKESRKEIERMLAEESIGYLGLSLDGTPYVVPLNYAYVEGKILFHCALKGKKLDYLKKNKSVCFTVARQSGIIEQHEGEKPCHTDSASVMCFGEARIIEDISERHKALNTFKKCFEPNSDQITLERAKSCYAVEIRINEMTGRQETNLECKKNSFTYWQYRFDE